MLTPKQVFALKKMLLIIEEIQETITRFRNGFFDSREDKDLLNSLSFNLIQLGTVVSDGLRELEEKYPELRDVRGFRNDLTHDYFSTDLNKIWFYSNKINRVKAYVLMILSKERR